MKIKKLLCVIGVMFLSTSVYGDSVQKKAFKHGITSAVKAIAAERKHTHTPITKGYCIEMRGIYGKGMTDAEVVTLEVLASFLGVVPSYLSHDTQNGKENKLLCLAMSNTKKEAKSILSAIRKKHKAIVKYTPTVVALQNLHTYRRIIPAVGIYHEDQTHAINLLSTNIEKLKKKKNKEINRLKKELDEERKRLSSLRVKLKGLFSDTTFSKSELRAIEKRAIEKEERRKEAKRKALAAAKKKKEEEKMRLSNGSKIVKKKSSSRIYTIEKK